MAYSSSFFDPKHFSVEKSVRKLIYFLTPNRQYKAYEKTLLELQLRLIHLDKKPLAASPSANRTNARHG